MTRSHDKPLAPDEAEMLFDHDTPTGMVVACGHCHQTFECKHGADEVERCPNPKCQKWLVYRPWCEW